MFPKKDGTWNSTGPAGGVPRNDSETERPTKVMVMVTRWPAVVGELVTEIGMLPWSQPDGRRRPTTREPSDRGATSESSSTLSAPAIPQAWGDAPWPADGWRPTQGEVGSGALELSHHERGPL